MSILHTGRLENIMDTMDYMFTDLVDIDKLRTLFENFTKATNTGTAILDLDGNVLIATGWQDICTRFHRIHPETARRCRESDTVLAGQLSSGSTFNIYQCKNGLLDVAVPIQVEGMHVGNLFTGQFFFEKPDVEFFRRQARRYQFDEPAYLEALQRVPIITMEQVKQTTEFLCQLAGMIGEMGVVRLNLMQSNEEMQQEIESRRKAEKKLATQTELLDNVLNNIPFNVFWKDKSSVYAGCNQAFADVTGVRDPKNIVGKSDHDLPWTKQEADFYRQGDRKVVETGKPLLDIEGTLTQADGRTKTMITSTVPLRNQDGSIFGILGIYYDITERKKMEAIIQQAQKMDSIGTLAGGIAHEFNNILGGILGYSEIAKDDAPVNSPVQESLEEISKLGMRARDVVRQILSFSRKDRQERRLIQPHRIIAEELRVLRATIPVTVEIRHSLDEHSGSILGDVTQIQQVVMNLCTNAAHAMGDNGGILDIGLSAIVLDAEGIKSHPDLEPGQYVKLTVRDTGAGIDETIIDKIFDPFFTTKGVGHGTGMGLAVVHGIVLDHGGSITVRSAVGQGTTFTVLLPRAHNAVEEMVREDHLPSGTENILIVDDEEFMVFTRKKMLERLGYTVTAMNSSLETLELFKQDPHRYDLIITDLTMPHLTGDRLAAEVTAIRRDMPVILATGYADAVDREKVKQSGIAAFLPKPCKKQDLAKTIRLILDRKTTR